MSPGCASYVLGHASCSTRGVDRRDRHCVVMSLLGRGALAVLHNCGYEEARVVPLQDLRRLPPCCNSCSLYHHASKSWGCCDLATRRDREDREHCQTPG